MDVDELLLWDQAVNKHDRHAPLVYSDWLRDRGRDVEADYWQDVSQWREESLSLTGCRMWMYSCTELAKDWTQLLADGCSTCRKWARLNTDELSCRSRAGLHQRIGNREVL